LRRWLAHGPFASGLVEHSSPLEARQTHARRQYSQGAAERFSSEPVDSSLSPEESFDRTWALNMIEQALAELRDEYGASGQAELYGALAQHVWGDSRAEAHAVTESAPLVGSRLLDNPARRRKR
jgi:hypothetical protein